MEGDGQPSGLEDAQQNLNDLQNYLVHFNKEIEVTGEASFQHSVSQILTQAVQPVYVSVPGTCFVALDTNCSFVIVSSGTKNYKFGVQVIY